MPRSKRSAASTTDRAAEELAHQAEYYAKLPLDQRSASFEWRRRWFALSRSADERALGKARDLANAHKRHLIDTAGRNSGMIAGYDPAGAGSPWFPIGPRNVNGRDKALAVHPTDPDTLYAGAASGGVRKTIDGGQT